LPSLLSDLARTARAAEIVVVDGGSIDDTARIARDAGAKLISASRGRGAQMNAGAGIAGADVLLFLHADSRTDSPRLIDDALAALGDAIADAGHDRIAGHFALRFSGAAPEHATFYRYLEGKTRLNRPNTINGDQGLLIARRFFEALGGFDERLPFLEDQRIAAKIAREGEWIMLPGELHTSARRFETEGVTELYSLMALIMGLYAAGADDFFAAAPKIYTTADGRLDLKPQLDAIARYLDGMPFRGRARLLLKIGAFIRDNAWQLAYRRDVLRNDGELRALARFDRFVAPLLANPAASALGAVLARGWLASLRLKHR
jgi:rSAM/selenodomain-associated transferase 2